MINLFFVVHDYSGAGTYANELLGNLATDKDITVYKVYLESIYYKEYTEIEESGVICIHIPEVRRKINFSEKYSLRCIDLITPVLNGKSSIIFHLNKNVHLKLGTIVRERFNAQIVYTLHYLPNYISWIATGACNPRKIVTTGNAMDYEVVQKVDHIICVTKFAKNILCKHYSAQEIKLTVIYNGCSLFSRDLPENEFKKTVKEKFGFNANDKILLFVGRLQQGKGVEKLIEAFTLLAKKYVSLKLVIIGKGELEPYAQLCKDNHGRIFFTGKLSPDQLNLFYRIADIGVIPSEFEQCSYVALEMMHHGLPIVCSNAPGLRELFKNGKTALIVPLQKRTNGSLGLEIAVHKLSRAVGLLLDNVSLAGNLGRNAYRNWQNQYTAAHMGEATIHVYQQILERNNSTKSQI